MIYFFNHCAHLGRDTPFVVRFHHDYDAAFGRVIHDALVCFGGAVHHPEYFAFTACAAKCADQSRAQNRPRGLLRRWPRRWIYPNLLGLLPQILLR